MLPTLINKVVRASGEELEAHVPEMLLEIIMSLVAITVDMADNAPDKMNKSFSAGYDKRRLNNAGKAIVANDDYDQQTVAELIRHIFLRTQGVEEGISEVILAARFGELRVI